MTAQFYIDGKPACRDKEARLSHADATVVAEASEWRAVYSFEGEHLRIELASLHGIYALPIVCSKEQRAILSEDKRTLSIFGGVTITSSVPMDVDTDLRAFNQVGVLAYLPISIPVNGCAEIMVQ